MLSGWSRFRGGGADAHGKGEVALEAILPWGMKKVSRGDEDTLRRDAVKRADSAVCGRVISCSRGQQRRRPELEL